MSEVCPHCGRSRSMPSISASEVFLNIACAILLLSASILIYRVAGHWLDLQMHKISDRMVWREPLQSWD